MASAQDLETRLDVVERKLNWFMNCMRQTITTEHGAVTQSLNEIYREVTQNELSQQASNLARDHRLRKATELPKPIDASTTVAEPDLREDPDSPRDTQRAPEESFEQLRERLRAEGIL